MPRKPQPARKRKITVVVEGVTVDVMLHPPAGTRRSWYAYWSGLTTSRSTGHTDFAEAVKAAEDMLRSGGRKRRADESVLSDEEFEEIQRRHFAKKKGELAQKKSSKSLTVCLEALSAFRAISGVQPITIATADDCERFQNAALALPSNWRSQHPKKREDADLLSPNTVIKWSVALQAAFERASRSSGKKCVRGVVPEAKLLTENPWKNFTWIEGSDTVIRQFDGSELVSFLDFLESAWKGVTVGPLMAKLHLWSSSRREEIAGLRWDSLRIVRDEVHFEVVGKWNVLKWFRIPEPVYRDLEAIRTDSAFVFGAFPDQLRRFHEIGVRPWLAKWIKSEFDVYNTGRWFYERVADWSKTLPNGSASTHVFRKTTLQYARRGEDINRQVASDARVSEAVMMSNYVKETDEEMRQKSNRIFARIRASLPSVAAKRYGFIETEKDRLVSEFHRAAEAKDWAAVAQIAACLEQTSRQAG